MSEAALTQAEVRAIAELARLELSDADVARYQKQLSDILVYFQKLEELDTSHIDPTSSVLPLTTVMRADEAGSALTVDQVIANAPDSDGEQFRVRAVLGADG
ncbi:MAG: Asp-tRNA(Asn)/Glu-tRNA(Gln) amidotransferase subunit GatC [Chloroflexi bacterium]|nr:Asp-tRNA(Asn)/Glu-tRNA(Gln) amidotransferase subunit GatC [Chloroflexota bacterium]MCY3583979.1 Asp-tRNA(Asn)/Glu-tRNA(Gln) amidotransferase subunit GatC [Chloroflexota bacterium]MCY3717718.1 Asp-tRNA(Asn)/Glu-tRNA(Gln) amidotransferase subunit GatC [Chloroflexota bacterium]MDE2649296.1 Asp-tRNA(Asn)/Glu-tRNA(Gln) amidotransferase subunit GatC [Chloroflexota bacterium]MXV92952.1 Asp-tRNA(Asn)/Glu-tRNA(Gln) amidotransferase subunit GatC [Chloroflexota bacterium]